MRTGIQNREWKAHGRMPKTKIMESTEERGGPEEMSKNTEKQIKFIQELANRLNSEDCPTRIKADAIRLRRELNTLSKMQE